MSSPDLADAERLLAELQQTAGELQQEVQAFESAMQQLKPATVQDDSGSVSLTVAPDGTVQSLVLDEEWRDAIGESVLGSVISSSYQNARIEIVSALTTHLENTSREGATPIAESAPVELGDPTTAWAAEGREELRALYDAASAEKQAFVDNVARTARQESEDTNATRSVTVTRQGDSITAVKLDDRWVRNSSDSVIEQAVVTEMNRALALSASEQERRFDGFPAIAQLAKLGNDPRELMRRMGSIR